MKGKLLLASMLVGFAASAQSVVSTNSSVATKIAKELEVSKVENFEMPHFSKANANKGGAVSNYYSYTDTMTAFLTDLDGYNLSLSPDSTTTIIYSDGSAGNNYFHGAGAIYDMTFHGWAGNQFAEGDQVTLDSVFILGFYNIFNSNQSDTLRFHIFHGNIASNAGFDGVSWNAGVFSYFPTVSVPQSTMAYTGGAAQGNVGGITASNVTVIDHIFNTNDSASTVHGVAVPNFTFDAADALGIYVEYIPGNYGFSDTVDFASGTGTTNSFGMFCYGEPDFNNSRGDFIAYYDSTYMNASNFVIDENRYGMFSAQFLNEMTYPWADLANFIIIHASGTSSVSVEEAEMDTYSIYPNPSNGLVKVELNATTEATVKVVDITGQVVFAATENFTAGSARTFDLSNNAKGMYIMTVKADGINIVERLTIK